MSTHWALAETNKPLYLVVHNNYHTVAIGLFSGETCIGTASEQHKKISATFLILVDQLLTCHSIALDDLRFIAVHQGPSAFTTLRVLLSFVNGLGYAKKIPLIGINSFLVMFEEQANEGAHHEYQAIVLNGFCGDVYFAIKNTHIGTIDSGCMPYSDWQKQIAGYAPATVLIFGHEQFVDPLRNVPEYAHCRFSQEIIASPSLNACAAHAVAAWRAEQSVERVLPIYLKPPVIFGK